jgi:hypothetical protein
MLSENSENEENKRKISINSGTMDAYKSLIVEYKYRIGFDEAFTDRQFLNW